jgi:hypothetical protein
VKAACRGDAIIGRGRATVEIAFPEVAPIVTEAELTVINGGVRGGVTTLYATAYLTVPTPATLAAKVKIEKIHNGHFGTEATVAIPKVAGGSGSVTSFNATIDRRFSRRGKTVGVATLKCPDGKVLARADELFADGTHLEAKLSQPCIPKDEPGPRARSGLGGKLSRGARIRTEDLGHPKAARYQAAPHPDRPSLERSRTGR